VSDQADWLPPGTQLWRLASGSVLQRLGLALRLGVSGWWQATRAILGARRDGWVYVPYPAPLTLWWMSFCPRRWRPRCVADAYISIWDSMFRDRGHGSTAGLLSRMVWRFERRSLRVAHRVLVDTQANRLQMIQDFGLEPGNIVSLPLAIDEQAFLGIAPRPAGSDAPLRVLFVGTLVPLHGIEVVLGAIEALADDPRFDFRLIGDGQMGGVVEAFVQRVMPRNLTWVREWCGLQRIVGEIEEASICLGVFGGQEKAARVLPFKLYMYLAAGKPVVTQARMSVPDGAPAVPISGTTSDPLSLAEALLALATDQDMRVQRGRQSRDYYRDWLANARLELAWEKLIR
ncbi:MAG: glycosyltransferase, partial [Proteobacteria bacterium]